MSRETDPSKDLAERLANEGRLRRHRKLFTDATWEYALTGATPQPRRDERTAQYAHVFGTAASRLIASRLLPEHMDERPQDVMELAFHGLTVCLGDEVRRHWETYNPLLKRRGIETIELDEEGLPTDQQLTFDSDGLKAQWEELFPEGCMTIAGITRAAAGELTDAMKRQCHRELLWLPRVVNLAYVSQPGQQA